MRFAPILLLLVVGCQKKEAPPAEPPKPAIDAASAPVAPDAAADAGVVYTPEKAQALLAELDRCAYEFDCPPFATLVAFGDKVAPQLVARALDEAKPVKARLVALKALASMKASGAALPLHAAARRTADFRLRRAIYGAVGEAGAGDPEVFAALQADYAAIPSATHRVPVLEALARFPKMSREWAFAAFGDAPERETAFASLIDEVAQKGDLPRVNAALAKATNPMAKHRLAAKAIELGDPAHYSVFLEGLASENAFDRADAANMLARVVAGLPEALKPKTIELLEAARAKDRGGLTSIGYDKSLEALRAE